MAEISRLAAAIAAAKGDDALAPVTVAVPSNYAGLALRRSLARQSGGLVNVEFTVLPRVAERLGAPALAAHGLKPITRAIRGEAVRAALADDAAGLFAPVAGHASTVDALDRTFGDLRDCDDATLDRIAATSRRAGAVVKLFRATRARLESRYYDEHDVAAAATGDVGGLIVYMPRRVSPAMRAMADALGATFIEPADGAPPERIDRVISAVDPDDEVRAAVRVVMERVRVGTPLHRIALTWPADDPYALIVHQQLDSAAIPYNGPTSSTLAQTVTGAALVHVLALADRNFRRDDVMAWMASAPIIELANGADIGPASQWDVISARAGVIEGAEQWHARVASFAASRVDRKSALALEDDVEPWRVEQVDADIDRAGRLRAFMAELVVAADPGDRDTWAGFSEWAGGLLERYLGPEARHYRWPDTEQDAWRSVHDAVEQLAALDGVSGATVDLARFRQAVGAELAAPAGRHGTFGTGIFCGSVALACATDFDVVIVLGLAEGSLPGARAEDPLLHDEERVAGAELVALRGTRIQQEWADFQAALAAAGDGERVVTFPRTDPRRRRERLPSRWLPSDAEPDRIDSFQHGITAGAPASLAEYDLRELLDWTERGGDPIDHVLAAEVPSLGAGLVAAGLRSGNEFTRFDGNVGAGKVDPFERDIAHSPTSLENYAVCPARYFYQRVLRIGPPEKPEEIRSISPLDKGSLFHGVLEQFVIGVLADAANATEARLFELAEAAFDDYESRGLTGLPLLWRYDREVMRREFLAFLVADDDGAVPLAAEFAFGPDAAVQMALTLANGRKVAFRGSADRVDRMPDGALRVTDYKTGAGRGFDGITSDDPLDRGRKLQLPLYGLAARSRFGTPDSPVDARYLFVSRNREQPEVSVPINDATITRLREVLGVLVDGITAGRFPARPGDEDTWQGGWVNCRYCDFDRICAADRDRAWERVRAIPALGPYRGLAEGPA